MDTDEALNATYRELVQRRGRYLPADFNAKELTEDQLEGRLSHTFYNAFVDYKRQWQALLAKASAEKPARAFIGDLTQSGSYLRASQNLPTLTRKTELYSFSRGHLFTDSELELSQGWPVECCESIFSADLPYSYLGGQGSVALPGDGRRSLRGNSVHLPCITSWLLYCMMNTKRKTPFDFAPTRPLRGSSFFLEDDGGEAEDTGASGGSAPKRLKFSRSGSGAFGTAGGAFGTAGADLQG